MFGMSIYYYILISKRVYRAVLVSRHYLPKTKDCTRQSLFLVEVEGRVISTSHRPLKTINLPDFCPFLGIFVWFSIRFQLLIGANFRTHVTETLTFSYSHRQLCKLKNLLVVLPWLSDMIAYFYHGCVDRFVCTE